MEKQFVLPPRLRDDTGMLRGVGFELEVGNIEVLRLAEGLAAAMGGRIRSISSFEVLLEGSTLGSLKIERDTHLLTSLGYRNWLRGLGVDFSPGSEGERWERNVDNLSRQLVPCEVVTAPVPINQLQRLRPLVSVIEAMEGRGTQNALHYAFGLHINPAVPSSSAAVLLAYIQGFLLLNDWIIEDAKTDFTRRFFTKYIDPFPHNYYELVLDANYQPGFEQLLGDYLYHNPTRNRGLDMLPVFYLMEPQKVLRLVNENERHLMKGRPAFHYRLPDCGIGRPGWTLEDEWNRWQLVEVLASDEALRREILRAWRSAQTQFRWNYRGAWIAQTADLVNRIRAQEARASQAGEPNNWPSSSRPKQT